MAVAPVRPDPAASFKQLEARMQEHVEQRRFETLAREAEAAYGRRDLTPEQRRAMAFFAVQGLHGMWEVARQPAGLCQARNLLRRVERELGFANDRAIADRLRRDTETRLQETGLRNPCAPARPVPGQKLPLASAQPATPPPQPAFQPAIQPAMQAVPQDMDPETGAPPLLATPLTPRPATAGVAGPVDGSAQAITAPERRRPPPSPGRIAGGALLLAAGAAGWVGMALLLRDANGVDRQVMALHQEIVDSGQMWGNSEQVDRLSGYVDEHEGLTAGAAAVGTVAGLATLGGVLLVALRPRTSHVAARPWASRWTAGVTLAGSF